jgi:hypothetical protein
MSKDVKLILVVISIFITMPLAGFLFSIKPIIGAFSYITQIGILINVIKEWYNNTK